MKKLLSFGNLWNSRQSTVSKTRHRPHLEPLEDRHLLSVTSLLDNPFPAKLETVDGQSEMKLTIETDTAQSAIIGIQVTADSDTFDPSALKVYDAEGNLVSGGNIRYSNADFLGKKSSILVLELAPGDYKVCVGGDHSTVGNFSCDVFLPGDIYGTGTVDDISIQALEAVSLLTSGTANLYTLQYYSQYFAKLGLKFDQDLFISAFDINGDQKVDPGEMDIVRYNAGAGLVTVSLDAWDHPLTVPDDVSLTVGEKDQQATEKQIDGVVDPKGNGFEFLTGTNNLVVVEFKIDGVKQTTIPAGFEISITKEGLFSFHPNGKFDMIPGGKLGELTIQYKVRAEGSDTSITGTITVTIEGENDAPTAENATITPSISADSGPVEIDLSSFIDDVDLGEKATLIIVVKVGNDEISKEHPGELQLASGAKIAIDAAGKLTYNPNGVFYYLQQDAPFEDEFDYYVKDVAGAESSVKTVTVTVTGINSSPEATGDLEKNTDEKTSLTFHADEVLDKVEDPNIYPNSDELSIKEVDTVSDKGATVTFNQTTGIITYNPGDIFSYLRSDSDPAEDFFHITVQDEFGATVKVKVIVTIDGVDDPFTISNPTPSMSVTSSGTAEWLPLSGTLGVHCPDEGVVFVYEITNVSGGPSGYPLTAADFTIDPATQMIRVRKSVLPETSDGDDYTITVKVTDTRTGLEQEATITITMSVVLYPPPVIGQPTKQISAGENDTDYKDTKFTATDEGPDHSNVVFLSNVTVKSFTVNGTSVTFTGTLDYQLNADGTFKFRPNGQFAMIPEGGTGLLTIEYTAKNTQYNVEAKGTFTITISGVNNVPVIINTTPASLSVTENLENTSSVSINARANTNDPDIGDVIVVGKINGTAVSVGDVVTLQYGSVKVNADGTLTYTTNGKVNVGAPKTETFTYHVTDGHLQDGVKVYSATAATVTINVTGVNHPHEIKANQSFAATSTGDSESTVKIGPVEINDLDGPSSSNGKYTLAIAPASDPNGDFELRYDGDQIYLFVKRGNLPETGTINLSITVSDDDFSDTKAVTVNVSKKAPPTCNDQVVAGSPLENSTAMVPVDVASLVTPTETGDVLRLLNTVTLVSAKLKDGTDCSSLISAADLAKMFTVNASNEWVLNFTPNPQNAGPLFFIPGGDELTLVVNYGVEETGMGTGKLTFKITGVNNTPTAGPADYTADVINADDTGGKLLDVLALCSDLDLGDVLSITSIAYAGTTYNLSGGTAMIPYGSGSIKVTLESGKLRFYTNGAFNYLKEDVPETFTFSYTITDGTETASSTVKVKVVGVNFAPVIVTGTTDAGKTIKNLPLVIPGTKLFDPAIVSDPNGDDLVIASIKFEGQEYNLTKGGTITLPGGDTFTLGLDGKSITYNPGDRFNALGIKDAPVPLTFTYKVTDGKLTSVNERTVTFSVTPQKSVSIENIAQRGGTKTINLDDYFSGTGVTYEVSVDFPPSNVPHADMFDWSYNSTTHVLTFTFKDYDGSDFSRLPAVVTIVATDSDNVKTTEMFTVVAIPEKTVSVDIVTVSIGTPLQWNADNISAATTTFNVGDEYYIEIWVTDLANNSSNENGYIGDDYSRGLSSATVSVAMNSAYVEYLDYEYNEMFYAMTRNPSVNIEDGILVISNFGGAITAQNIGNNGKSWLIGRIKVQATAPATGDNPLMIDIAADSVVDVGRNSTVGEGKGRIDRSQVKVNPAYVQQNSNNPLFGVSVAESVIDGGVYTRVVSAPTGIRADGTIRELPDNADWIHEWQTHWVEVWVKASEVQYYKSAMTNLTYDTRYFTATLVQQGQVFVNAFNPSIDDPNGLVTGIGGKASGIVPDEGYILLGSVKFESIGSDNVPWSEASIPHDLGIHLENAVVLTNDDGRVSFMGNSPTTELWAIPYDVNDCGYLDAGAFSYFYEQFSAGNSGGFVLSGADYNRDGLVDSADWFTFKENYCRGVSRDGDSDVFFPADFTKRYIGKKLNTDDDTTVSMIISAANKAWQNALGLEKPIDVKVIVKDLGPGKLLGESQIVALDDFGRPSQGIIIIDDDAAGLGWYSQIADPVATGRYDLYTVLLHEMGHLYGFSTNYDAFREIVGQFDASQIDSSGLHAADSQDLMFATLETGVRKYITTLDTDMVLAAYRTAENNANLRGFDAKTAALHATKDSNKVNSGEQGVVLMNESSVITGTSAVGKLLKTTESVDQNTAAKLHAMGLAVSIPIEESARNTRISKTDILFAGEPLVELEGESILYKNHSWRQNESPEFLLDDLEINWIL